ncbi:hypothetical protein ACFL3S_06745 [Gemmatimonadota bacterium]
MTGDRVTACPLEDLKAGRVDVVKRDIIGWVERLEAVAFWLHPFLPGTSLVIRSTLREKEVQKSVPLFPRLVS